MTFRMFLYYCVFVFCVPVSILCVSSPLAGIGFVCVCSIVVRDLLMFSGPGMYMFGLCCSLLWFSYMCGGFQVLLSTFGCVVCLCVCMFCVCVSVCLHVCVCLHACVCLCVCALAASCQMSSYVSCHTSFASCRDVLIVKLSYIICQFQ